MNTKIISSPGKAEDVRFGIYRNCRRAKLSRKGAKAAKEGAEYNSWFSFIIMAAVQRTPSDRREGRRARRKVQFMVFFYYDGRSPKDSFGEARRQRTKGQSLKH